MSGFLWSDLKWGHRVVRVGWKVKVVIIYHIAWFNTRLWLVGSLFSCADRPLWRKTLWSRDYLQSYQCAESSPVNVTSTTNSIFLHRLFSRTRNKLYNIFVFFFETVEHCIELCIEIVIFHTTIYDWKCVDSTVNSSVKFWLSNVSSDMFVMTFCVVFLLSCDMS